MKGIAYVGALEVLDREGILNDIERVAGTSAGAMVAVMVALNYTAEEMRQVLEGLNFKDFKDSTKGILRDTIRLFKNYGWYKGDYFRNLMAKLIEKKTGNGEMTFEQLAGSILALMSATDTVPSFCRMLLRVPSVSIWSRCEWTSNSLSASSNCRL